MCHYISVILPARADENAVRQLADEFGHGLKLIENPHVSRQFIAGERQFMTARKHCDCGTPIGSALHGNADTVSTDKPLDRQIADLRRKGWSQSKIDRWLLQHQTVRDRTERINRDRLRDGVESCQPHIEDWIAFLQQIVNTGASPYVGLMLHMYQGRLETERIVLQERQTMHLADLTAQVLLNVHEDVVYIFRR